MNWYNRGAAGAAQTQAKADSARMRNVDRYYLGEGKQGALVAVDTEPFNINEHQFATPGPERPDWKNFGTCVAGIGECAYCAKLAKMGRPTFYTTAIDVVGWVGKDGAAMGRGELKLLGLNSQSFPKWSRANIVPGAKVKMARDAKADPTTGLPESVTPPAPTWREDFFPHCSFRGKKLSEIYDRCEKEPAYREAVSNVFVLETGPDGRLLRRVPSFNYMKLLEPLPVAAAAAHVASAILTTAKGKGAAKGRGGGGVQDDPFGVGATASPFANDFGGGDETATVPGASNPDDDIPF